MERSLLERVEVKKAGETSADPVKVRLPCGQVIELSKDMVAGHSWLCRKYCKRNKDPRHCIYYLKRILT